MAQPIRRSVTIVELATAVYDNGRRGGPKPGCDCVQCFGYCMVDQDAYQREMVLRSESHRFAGYFSAWGERDDSSSYPLMVRGHRA